MISKSRIPEPFEDEIECSRYDESIPYTDPRWDEYDGFIKPELRFTIPGIRKWRYGPGGALTTNCPIEGITQTLDRDSELFYGYKYFVGESILKTCSEKLAKLLDKEFVCVEYYVRTN